MIRAHLTIYNYMIMMLHHVRDRVTGIRTRRSCTCSLRVCTGEGEPRESSRENHLFVYAEFLPGMFVCELHDVREFMLSVNCMSMTFNGCLVDMMT